MSDRAVPTREECLAVISDLIAFPTVSRDPNKDLLFYAEDLLKRHGVESEIIWNEDKTKGNLWATIGPADKPGVILSGHSDVVPVDGQDWTSDPFELRHDGDRVFGRGTADMKGFVALTLAFVPYFAKCDLKAPIHLAISYDEEVGCTGVRSLVGQISQMEVKPALCIVGEPTSMQVILGHKGGAVYRVDVTGQPAHSSLSPTAVNAIEYAAEIIGYIREMAAEQAESGAHDHHFDVPYTTLTTTLIEGGTATNIVPGSCEFKFGIRALPGVEPAALVEKLEERVIEELLPRMKAISPRADVTFEPVAEIPGLDTDADHPGVTFMKRLVGRNDHAKVAYGTEAGLFARDAGVVAVVCGPGSIEQAHKADEFLEIDQIDRCRDMLAKLGETLERTGLDW